MTEREQKIKELEGKGYITAADAARLIGKPAGGGATTYLKRLCACMEVHVPGNKTPIVMFLKSDVEAVECEADEANDLLSLLTEIDKRLVRVEAMIRAKNLRDDQ